MKKILAMIFAIVMAVSVFAIGASASSYYDGYTIYSFFVDEYTDKPLDESIWLDDDGDGNKTVFIFDENHNLTKVEMYNFETVDGPEELYSYATVSDRVGNTYKLNLFEITETGEAVPDEVWEVEETDNFCLKKVATYDVTEDGELEPDDFYTFTYDAKGNLIKELDEYYYDGVLQNTYTKDITYDANGNVTEEMWTYEYVGGSVSSIYKNVYTYDADGKLVKEEYGDVVDGVFEITDEETYTYPDATHRNRISKSKEGEVMVIDGNATETFDANGNVLEYISFYSEDNGETWCEGSKYVYEYDADGNVVKCTHYDDYSEEDGWELCHTETYKYHVIPAKEEPKKENPETGDATPVVILASVMALSLAGVVITKKLAK